MSALGNENLRRVIDAIREASRPEARPEIGFNMASFEMLRGADDVESEDRNLFDDQTGHDCDTVCCVGGWIPRVVLGVPHFELSVENIGGLIGIESYSEASELFFPNFFEDRLGDVPVGRVLDVLEHLYATGEVDWSVSGLRLK